MKSHYNTTVSTGNTDDTDRTDFHGNRIRVYPRNPCYPCAIRSADGLRRLLIVLRRTIDETYQVLATFLDFQDKFPVI